MSGFMYFYQECPTCGRTLQVRIHYLGRKVRCRHCQGEFQACDPSSVDYPPPFSGIDLMRRAEELLDSVQTRNLHPR